MTILILPFPPSTNRLTRYGSGNAYVSPQYAKWRAAAEAAFLEQKRDCGTPIIGGFRYHITLDEKKRRSNMDGDNRQKAVLDFLQAMGVIENDALANAGSWSWGPTEPGCCFVSVYREGGGL